MHTSFQTGPWFPFNIAPYQPPFSGFWQKAEGYGSLQRERKALQSGWVHFSASEVINRAFCLTKTYFFTSHTLLFDWI